MELSEIKKTLMREKTVARFSHYCAGSLYYVFELYGKSYQFPIETVEYEMDHPEQVIGLSSDLGTTTFGSEEKASMLIRWISKAHKDGNLIPNE